MNNIKHIIWDWNGTLLNDAWLFVKIMNQVLEKRGLKKITVKKYREIFCFPLESFYIKMGFDFKKESFEKSSFEFISLYSKHKNEADLYTGAKGLLFKLNKLGIKNYLLSAQNQQTLIDQVKFYKLFDFFDLIIGTDNLHARGKDVVAKKIFNKIIPHNNQILMIGDTNLDINISKKFNCNAIGAGYGHQHIKRFENHKNLKIVSNFNQLDFYLTSLFQDNQ